MLQLRLALGGQPNDVPSGQALAHLCVNGKGYIVYPSSDAVVVCDSDFNLSCVLSFASAVPGRASSSQCAVSGVHCDPKHGLIIAWRESHIVFWQHRAGDGLDAWNVRSTLVASSPVTCLDFKDGDLIVGMQDGLELWHVDTAADIPVWDKRWDISCSSPTRVCFSPATDHFASTDGHLLTQIYTMSKGSPQTHPQNIKHPRPMEWIGWRKPRDLKGGEVHLYTVANSVLRVYAPVLDDPSWFQLLSSVDGKCSRLLVLDADELRKGGEMDDDDLVCGIDSDGNLTIRAILNLERRPPTLLKTLTVSTIPSAIETHVAALISSDTRLAYLGDRLQLMVPGGEMPSYTVNTALLLASKPSGITVQTIPRGAEAADGPPRVVQMNQPIQQFVRTPNGRGLLAMGRSEIGVWEKRPVGKSKGKAKALAGKGHWDAPGASLMAIYAKGRGIVSYDSRRITIQHLHPHCMDPSPPVELPDFATEDEIVLLLAMSDIDDGRSRDGRRTERAYVIASSDKGEVWLWHVVSNSDDPPVIALVSRYSLPVPGLGLVLPVDPMGWHQSVIDWANDTPLQDTIVTITEGTLEFWTPRLSGPNWIRSGMIKTDKENVVIARCSSRKKTALATTSNELSIWDSKASDFASGLEFTQLFDDIIQDLDWTTTSDLQSVLAVGMPHKVVLVCEERMFYAENTPGWAAFLTIDISNYTSNPISDSIWLAGGSLAIGAGNQVLLYSRFLEKTSNGADATDGAEDIFQLIAQRNGPLVDFHPAMLAQCLLWDKIDLVKRVLVRLTSAMQDADKLGRKSIRYERLDASAYYDTINQVGGPYSKNQDESLFSEKMVLDLQSLLAGEIALPLDALARTALGTLAQAVYEIDQDRRALDTNGLRYIIAVRMLANRVNERMSVRNLVWATHSESKEAMLRAAIDSCSERMLWPDAKRLGIFQWLKGPQLAAQMDALARNTFLADDRDPTGCSLFYFALGKKRIVHGLWRQAAGHKEQTAMLRFLANDFDEPRWKTAANKNAYALLSKQRFAYAAAFFLLAGSYRDGINVCLRQLKDIPLAIAIARVVEGDDGPLLKWILTDTVVPLAFAGGHRWLGSWAFWMLGRRDLSIRMLISPMKDVGQAYDSSLPVGESENDDPSLGLLYQQLKGKTLQTAKGTSEITQRTEFNFVLHNARVFCRMGCHPLALALVRCWSFERPFFPSKRPVAHSPTIRRQSFMLAAGDAPRKSMMIMDMDVIESRAQSPEPATAPKVASLMKAAKPDASSQGAMEFDMGMFG